MKPSNRLLLLASMTLLATGCASINPQQGFDQIATDVDKRIGSHVHWYTGSEEDAQVRQSIQQQLQQPLTVESAVQIALLNNHSLQADYADIGISQADLVQAGLLKNPVLELTRLKPRDSGEPDDALDVELRFEFLDILLIPLKKKVAEQNYASVKQRVTGQILDHAARVRKAFYNVQAAQQTQNMAQEVVLSTEAALETAQRLHKIGNINIGSFNRFKLANDEANLALEEARMATRSNREAINKLLGLYGKQTQWRIDGGLKPIPLEAVNVDDIEQRVLGNSLDLAMTRHDMQALGEKAGIENIKSYINDLEAGYAWDREASGEWNDGPTIELRIPIFDMGQARRARVKATIQKLESQHRVQEINLRSTSRMLADRLTTARAVVEQYIDAILPLNRRIKSYELLNYNAMQIDVFKLLRAHEKQVMSQQRFVQALHNYWLARADLETLLSGRATEVAGMQSSAAAMSGGNEGGH